MTTFAADPGLFGPDSVTWTIHADPSMALGGLRALILHWSALTPFNRALTPSNRAATRRFLREARAKVWRNALLLGEARRRGRLPARLQEFEELSRERVAELQVPGQVLVRLARRGFGVELPSQ